MSTAAAESAPQGDSLIHIEPVKLAAPYLGNWRQVPAPTPRGYWVTHQLNNWTGGVELQMGSLGDHQPSPLIGWTWTGWKNPYVYAQAGELFILTASTAQVIAQGYGGVTVPRLFLTLQPRGGAPIETSAVISSNRSYGLAVRAPANGTYTLGVSFNIRSVRQGYAYPYCKINGTLNPVFHFQRRYFGASLAGAEGLPEGEDRLHRPEEREFADDELAKQLALLDEAEGIKIPDGPKAFTTAETT